MSHLTNLFSNVTVHELFTASAYVIALLLFLLLGQVISMLVRLSHELWNPRIDAVPPPLHPNGQKVLIIGDSTARGTGAKRIEDTIGGRLRKDFPNVEIINKAMNGAVTRQALDQLDSVAGEKFDIIFIATGGNDIVYLHSLRDLQVALSAVIERAIAISDHHVIVLFSSNFASAPVFPSWALSILERRTRHAHAIFTAICKNYKVPCLELFTEFKDDYFDINDFARDPNRYYAKDYMHPSGEGYGLWYKRIWREMAENDLASGLKN